MSVSSQKKGGRGASGSGGGEREGRGRGWLCILHFEANQIPRFQALPGTTREEL